jgi:hypothetical protein
MNDFKAFIAGSFMWLPAMTWVILREGTDGCYAQGVADPIRGFVYYPWTIASVVACAVVGVLLVASVLVADDRASRRGRRRM